MEIENRQSGEAKGRRGVQRKEMGMLLAASNKMSE
jgi:hypothetical protein